MSATSYQPEDLAVPPAKVEEGGGGQSAEGEAQNSPGVSFEPARTGDSSLLREESRTSLDLGCVFDLDLTKICFVRFKKGSATMSS